MEPLTVIAMFLGIWLCNSFAHAVTPQVTRGLDWFFNWLWEARGRLVLSVVLFAAIVFGVEVLRTL